MKYIVGLVLSLALYGTGHFVSLCMHTRFTAWLYPAYSFLMIASANVQDWSIGKYTYAKYFPWKPWPRKAGKSRNPK